MFAGVIVILISVVFYFSLVLYVKNAIVLKEKNRNILLTLQWLAMCAWIVVQMLIVVWSLGDDSTEKERMLMAVPLVAGVAGLFIFNRPLYNRANELFGRK